MEEEFLYGYLFGNGAVRVTLEADTLLGSLQAHLFDITLENGLITDDPHDLVDDALRERRASE